MASKFLNISIDNTLGGNSPSDEVVSSQKAIKKYVDDHSGGGGSVSVDGVTIDRNTDSELEAIGIINKNTAAGATNPLYQWVGTLAEYNAQQIGTQHPEWISIITDDTASLKWGDITGTLSNQTDLQNALDAKQNKIPAGTSGDVVTYTGTAGTVGSATLATVATSGLYSDLTGTPTIPTVNNATLTITQGGVSKGTFTANASSDVTIALDAGGGGASRNIGEIVQSTIPLTDAGLHLLDGALISGSGTYTDFVTYIAGLVSDYPDIFETEANWQTAVTTYGVCGKFVYDSINNTVRLPKITGFTEGTIDPTVLGDLTTAGLPNITGTFTGGRPEASPTGAFRTPSAVNTVNSGTANCRVYSLDASNSSAIYGNSSTVQPQSIKVLYYIVIATSVKTSIEVDIDQIATDLNGKADVDLTNINASCKPLDGQWVASSAILANAVTAPTSTGLNYSLSSYLPNDGYNYEVLFDIEGVTASSSGSYTVGLLKTDISSDCFVCEGRAQSSSGVRAAGNAILPVGTGRSVTIRNSSRNTGTITLYARGYRRIGTNS